MVQTGTSARSEHEAISSFGGGTVPIWYAAARAPSFPALRHSARADVCIVGAGIAGLTTAYFLASTGRKVIVLDEKSVGGGESGRTSAHLASAIDDRFFQIESVLGKEAARLHFASHAAAIDMIEKINRTHALDADFVRLDGYLVLGKDQPESLLKKELHAARELGVPGVEMLSTAHVRGIHTGPCLRFPGQARFDPLKYLFGLVKVLQEMGVEIYCGQRVKDLTGNGPVKAEINDELSVMADYGVAATNVPTPINNWVGIYTKQAAYRSYVLALAIPPDSVSDALYWDTLDPYHFVRLHATRDGATLIVGGEDHKTGQHPDPQHPDLPFRKLEAWGREHFPSCGSVVARWSGQVNEPDDGVAFIGKVPTPRHQACYVITGDSGMGLTHGTLGARLVADLILGVSNSWKDLYDPARRPTRSLGQFVRENVNAVAQMSDYVTPGESASTEEVPLGSGAVIRRGLKKLAIYKDPQGNVTECSAICPHLKCIVRWNGVESTWDCPCHGSRFGPTGTLITGPAVDDLRKES